MTVPNKRAVLHLLINHIAETLAQMASTAEASRRDATHEEAKPENDKDTRALEQSYLARGQAMRAEVLVEQLQVLRSLTLRSLGEQDGAQSGALVELEDDTGARWVFMAPFGGGLQLTVDGVEVLVITPVSALGNALLGKLEGDDLEVRLPGGTRHYAVLAVH